MRNHLRNTVCLLFLLLILPVAGAADAPELLSYQGVLTLDDGRVVPDGSYGLAFRIFDAPSAGNALYEKALSVMVQDGLYNVLLSEPDAGQNLKEVFRSGTQHYMEVEIESGPVLEGAAYPIVLGPRQRMASVPYALNSDVMPRDAIILWDRPTGDQNCDGMQQSGECPCGFIRALEFSGIGVRGAAVQTGTDIPEEVGQTCSDTSTVGCAADSEQYDDRLDPEEMPSHSHQTTPRLYQSDVFHNPGSNTVPTTAAGQNPIDTAVAGGDQPHYHPFRTVLFCRKS